MIRNNADGRQEIIHPASISQRRPWIALAARNEVAPLFAAVARAGGRRKNGITIAVFDPRKPRRGA